VPTTYTQATTETMTLLASARARYHSPRLSQELTIGVLMASAVTQHGAAAIAKVRIVPLRDRAHGLPDVEILLDEQHWTESDRAHHMALLDHELTHLLPIEDSGGRLMVDDLGRPRVRLRQHDWQVGWFHEVAKRHGSRSVEVLQAHALADAYGQLYFDFAETRRLATSATT